MSVIATALKHMLAAGVPHDQIVLAVAEMEAESLPPARSKGAARQARYRERQASQTVTSNAGDASDAKVSPTPLSKSSEAKASSEETNPRTRGTPKPARWKRVPEGWRPSAADLAVGAAEGFTSGEIERELAKYRDHEFAVPKTDADAAFRKWLRTAAERRQTQTVIPLNRHDRPNPSAKLAAKTANLERAFAGSEIAARARAERDGYP